jgi:hypothetical protein
MASVVTFGFDPLQETATGSGWVISYATDDLDPSSTVNETFATVTLAAARIQDIFSADPTIDAYFLAKAQAEILADESATVATELETLRTAEGLDATVPPP